MKTLFPKAELHSPEWFIIDATNKTLGRLSTEASKLLRGKETTFFTPGINLGNFVIIINASKIQVTGKKELQKMYYRSTSRPGNLKSETFKSLKKRIPVRIIERAIFGMLPKGVLSRKYYQKLYVYSDNKILFNNIYIKKNFK